MYLVVVRRHAAAQYYVRYNTYRAWLAWAVPPRDNDIERELLPRWAFPIGNRYQCHFSISIERRPALGGRLPVLPVQPVL